MNDQIGLAEFCETCRRVGWWRPVCRAPLIWNWKGGQSIVINSFFLNIYIYNVCRFIIFKWWFFQKLPVFGLRSSQLMPRKPRLHGGGGCSGENIKVSWRFTEIHTGIKDYKRHRIGWKKGASTLAGSHFKIWMLLYRQIRFCHERALSSDVSRLYVHIFWPYTHQLWASLRLLMPPDPACWVWSLLLP